MKNRMTAKKWLGLGVKAMMGAVVLAFAALQSINFFLFTFPDDQWYYAYLGLFLTGGGVICYLIILMVDADTELKKAISIVMLVACTLGELMTAGFGMQVEAWKQVGFVLTESDFDFMILVVKLLILVHGCAAIAYVAGDKIVQAFSDDDGDGIPNIVDRKDNRMRTYAADVETPEYPTEGQR